MTNYDLEKKFNYLVKEVSLLGTDTNKLFDNFYNLCKNFVKEVDECYTEAKEAEYEAISKSGNTRILEDC